MGESQPVTVGDIHWVELPGADGREQQGRRPAIIVQDESYTGRSPVILVVPLTTATAALRFVGTILIRPTAETGLQRPSVALVFQLRAIDRRRIKERIGRLTSEMLNEMFAELDKITGRTA
jgi:mRNA interferase MazF